MKKFRVTRSELKISRKARKEFSIQDTGYEMLDGEVKAASEK